MYLTRRKWSFFLAAIFLSHISLSVTLTTALAEPWTLNGEKGLWRHYSMPKDGKTEAVVQRIYYSVENQQFYLEVMLFEKNTALTVEAVENAKILFYRIDPRSGDAGWPAEMVLEEQLDELTPGKSLLVSSGLIRSVGNKSIAQPFGDLRAKTTLDEETYSVERKPGFPFFGKPYTETLGRGSVTLSLLYGSQPPWLVLKDTYQGNSKEYTAHFSADGRYLLIVLPDQAKHTAAKLQGSHRFLIAGPLPVNASSDTIVQTLKKQKQAAREKQKKAELKRLYREGKITAANYYGPVFTSARNKILQCQSVANKIGRITKLTLRDMVLDFGNPEIVGKAFSFSYEAEKGRGRLSAIALHPQFMKRWASKYKPYLETVDVHTDSETFYASCPTHRED
jgi:hypothetical protein